MGKPDFTPGPWRYSPDGEVYAEQSSVCMVLLNDDGEANARLIAAAPRMYKALNDLYTWAEKQTGDKLPAELGRARAAIVEAEGR